MSAPLSSAPRTALVTGAGKRLGREIALGLAKAGWRVAVHYRSSESEALQTAQDCLALNAAHSSLSSQTFIFQADLADEVATRQLLPRVVQQLGQVDAVVNSAALFEHDDVQTFSYANMAAHWASNTGAAIVLAQAMHQHCQARGAQAAESVVINMLDQKLWNPNPDFLSYTLSKAALESANTLLAQALAPLVRVVGVQSAVESATQVHITIEDTGIGIPANKVQHVFGEFNQVEDERNRQFEGTGLGLAICHRLIKLMGGQSGLTPKKRPARTLGLA